MGGLKIEGMLYLREEMGHWASEGPYSQQMYKVLTNLKISMKSAK